MSDKPLSYFEHEDRTQLKEEISLADSFYEQFFAKEHRGKDVSNHCFTIRKDKDEDKYFLTTSYYVGVDWVEEKKTAIYIAPKVNSENKELNFLQMLFSSLSHPEVEAHIKELFEVKWHEPPITITQQQDLLSPFLMVEFLAVLKKIVRKGLKKSYYKVEQNLQSRVKGKILVGKTIKKNQLQNKNLYTYCSYDEFGYNHLENRLLKKALRFVKQYLPRYGQFAANKDFSNTLNYITPAFQDVSDDISLSQIRQTKSNAFFKEYEEAIRLAKLILKRFGYHISANVKDKIQTPPFWLDMSKLFELYVLKLLKDRFHSGVEYHFEGPKSELDYLLKSEPKMVIDAKYKRYDSRNIDIEDIRQVSGYARLNAVYKELGLEKEKDRIIDCLIIYPQDGGHVELKEVELMADNNQLDNYNKIYKLGVQLPFLENSPS